jgi:FHA domain
MKAKSKDWKRLFALLDQYLDLEAGARRGWLDSLAHSDPGIEADMRWLIERHGQLAGEDFLQVPLRPADIGLEVPRPKSPHRFVLKSVASGAEIELSGVMIAGRLPESDLKLNSTGPTGGPSRRHARLSVTSNRVWLEDLGSKNGTFVNGRRIAARTALRSGDLVRFDIEEFAFRIERAPDQRSHTQEPPEAAVPDGPLRGPEPGAHPGSSAKGMIRALFRPRK